MFSSSSNSCCNNNHLFPSYTPPCNHHDVASNPNVNDNNNDDDVESTFSHGYRNSSFLETHLFTANHDHVVEEEEESVGATKKGEQTRKRATGKKDRHSKIYTAQGPRDRRMRLSLQIARKFFDLQDTLGFDKASKTIDWLFTKSKTAIKDLMSSLPVKHDDVSECQDQEKEATDGVKNERKTRNTALSKDCRDKARARARERTRDKMWRSLEKSNYLELGSSSSSRFEIIQESTSHSGQEKRCKSMEEDPKTITDLLQHQMDKLLGMRSRDHGTCTFTDDFLGFQQDWSIGNNNNNNNNARTFHSNYGSTPNHEIDTIFSGHHDVLHQHQNPSRSNIHLQHSHFLADH